MKPYYILMILLLVPVAFAGYGGENLTTQLSHYYNLDQASGAANDTIGTLHCPVLQGDPVEGQSGLNGSSVSFTGDDRYASTNNFNANTTGTLCMWLKPTAPATGKAASGRNDGGNNNGDWYYGMHTGNKAWFLIDCGGEDVINGDYAWVASTWWIVCAEWNSTTGGRLWVNGTLQADTMPTKTCAPKAASFGIGADTFGGTADFYWNGNIDDVMVWNRSLTSAEHVYLYNSGAGNFYPFTAGAPASNPPVITQSTYNCTSCLYYNGTTNMTAWRQNTGVNVTSRDRTPTISFSTDVAANCRINTTNANYTTMSSTSNCETTGTTAHVCSLGAAQAFPYGAGNTSVYIGCATAVGGSENSTSSSGALNLDIDLYQIAGYVLKKDATAYSGAWIWSILQRSNTSVAATNSSTNGYYALEAYRNIWSVCALDPTNSSQNMNCSAWVTIG